LCGEDIAMDIAAATTLELEAICAVDEAAVGNTSRREYLSQAIMDGKCYMAKMDHELAGFIIYDTTFYHQAFIWLVIVSPHFRRKGIAKALIRHIESINPTEKLFTSTNESNTDMQHLCEALGFMKSGWIENLDEGDPEIIYFKRK